MIGLLAVSFCSSFMSMCLEVEVLVLNGENRNLREQHSQDFILENRKGQ